VSSPVRAASEWAWRILVILLAVVAVGWVLVRLKLIVFPVIVALLVSALLAPIVRRLRNAGMPRVLAVVIVFIGGIVVVAGVLTALVGLLAQQFPDITESARDGVEQIRDWLATGPLHLSQSDIEGYLDEITEWIKENRGILAGGALATATAALELLTAALLTLFTTYFFLYDGARIWAWCAGLFPRRSEAAVLEAGRRSWSVLVSYVRATLIIAAVDGLGIGILLGILRVPLAAPLGVLVFFGAFVPIVGATVSGAVAVLVALVSNGIVAAVIVLIGVIAIQQLEGHILQPLIMGRFVRIHPLAVVLAVAAGAILAGVPGTVIAVPIAAVLKPVFSYFAERYRDREAAAAALAAAEADVIGGPLPAAPPVLAPDDDAPEPDDVPDPGSLDVSDPPGGPERTSP
jgi:predicted PurR-regulated permease PerM